MILHTDIVRGGCIASMARTLIVLTILGLQICHSIESPPRIIQCRQWFKAKPSANESSSWTEDFTFNAGESCVSKVTLQNSDNVMVNITDPRNCENFFKCQGLICWQCPCPEGLTFNPVTLQCDDTDAVCECPNTLVTEPAPPRTTIITAIDVSEIVDASTPGEKVITPASASGDSNAGDNQNEEESSNGVVIIVVIVALTVIILVALIIGFLLWQRGVFTLSKKPDMHPSSNDGYLHTLPAQERHVYAEIDERMVTQEQQRQLRKDQEDAQRQLQHIYAPPIPSNPPPSCVPHPHQTFTLPIDHQNRPYPAFSPGYPLHAQPTSQPRDLIRFSASSGEIKNNISQNNNHTAPDNTDNSSVTSCSGCSACSGASHQDNIDRRTLLRTANNTPPQPTTWNFVSKQVYI